MRIKGRLKTFAKEPYSIKNIMDAVIKQRKTTSLKVRTCGCIFENPILQREI